MRPHPEKKNSQKTGFWHLSIKSLSLKSPAIIFIVIALTVFASEALVMMLLYNINRELFLAGALADAALLVVIISPALYFLLFRPTVSLLNEREKSEQRFKTLAAATFEGIAISTHGRILDSNDQLTHILGYERQELIGKDVLDLVSPEDRDRVLASLEAGLESRLEYEMLRKDGSRVSVEARGQTIEQQGLPVRLTAIRDITERKTYEKEGRLAATLYEASSEAMVITDSNNRIVSVNPAFTEITGYRADEVLGKTPDQICSQQSEAFCKEMLYSLATTSHWVGEAWDKKKDGQSFAASVSISAIPDVTGSGQSYAAQFSDITEKKRMEEIISRHANFDFLTGLSNRRLFHELLGQEIKNAHRSHKSLALMFIDLDRFKDINDVLGHAVGDRVLIETARRIVACVRESDIVSRLGGDEFTVILSEVSDANRIEKVADAIIHSINQPYHLGEELFLSASIGITVYPTDATNPGDLIRNADQAMYLSKSEGRNCFHFFTEKMQEAAQKRHQLAQDLYGALSGNQFLLHFQPIVDLKTGELFKAEALLRWQHPVRGMIEPAEFISVAEEIGVIDEIGDWVFKESLEHARRWTELIDHAFRLGVNISPVQFRAQHKIWINHVHEMKQTGTNASIEITEGTLLVDRPEVVDTLHAVHKAGMEVIIDDFGTGYSSLSYLQKFKIDYIKIDKSFIHNLAPGSSDLALSEAIIAVAHKLGIKVVAEGIETEVQRDLMVAAGCDFGQGYFFSKPVPREEFEELLQNSIVSGRPPPAAAGPSPIH